MSKPFPPLCSSRLEESPFDASALPSGFHVDGVRCGISAHKGKKDLALFYSDRPARAAGVFTQNLFQAAPVTRSRKNLKSSKIFRGIIANSGCANACTGKRGASDADWSLKSLGAALHIPPRQFLLASTGLIGTYLPRKALGSGVRVLSRRLRGRGTSFPRSAAEAVMTTDTRPKAESVRFRWGDRWARLWGCAKGAGMIHPKMATMLGFILTDVDLPGATLKKHLSEAVRGTFNAITVDGDTSTNDSVFLLANGAAGRPRGGASGRVPVFRAALHEICLSLSRQLVEDGEGVTRSAWIFVRGARAEKSAARIAETVATSPLVKTALHGADPNWGRVLAAMGRSGAMFDPGLVEVRFGKVVVCRKGQAAAFREKELRKAMLKPHLTIDIDLHQGKASSHYFTGDFSKQYVAINAEYTT